MPGRDVRDAHRRVGRVDALAAGAARAERVDAQILLVDLDVDFLGLGQHRDGRGRRVDAAAGFGGRHALHAVHAALVLQLAVDALALDQRDDFLDAAGVGVAGRHHLELPALALGVARVHAEQVGGEQRRFVAAGAGADFEDDVLLVVRDPAATSRTLELCSISASRSRSSAVSSSCASSRISASPLAASSSAWRSARRAAPCTRGKPSTGSWMSASALACFRYSAGSACTAGSPTARSAPRSALRARDSLSNIRVGPSTLRIQLSPRTPAAGTRPRRRRAPARPSARNRVDRARTSTGRTSGRDRGVSPPPADARRRRSSRRASLAVELARAGDVAQPREQPHGHAHASSAAPPRAPLVVRIGGAPSIQTSPPSKNSCFQIGAICLTRSMAYRHTANASARCGDAAAMATLASPICERADPMVEREHACPATRSRLPRRSARRTLSASGS